MDQPEISPFLAGVFAPVHAVYLDGGRARYKNRWVNTPGPGHERAAGHGLFGGILNFTFPPAELIGECGIFKNAANTNIVAHAGKYLPLWEGGFPTVITRELDTVGQSDLNGKLLGAMTATRSGAQKPVN